MAKSFILIFLAALAAVTSKRTGSNGMARSSPFLPTDAEPETIFLRSKRLMPGHLLEDRIDQHRVAEFHPIKTKRIVRQAFEDASEEQGSGEPSNGVNEAHSEGLSNDFIEEATNVLGESVDGQDDAIMLTPGYGYEDGVLGNTTSSPSVENLDENVKDGKRESSEPVTSAAESSNDWDFFSALSNREEDSSPNSLTTSEPLEKEEISTTDIPEEELSTEPEDDGDRSEDEDASTNNITDNPSQSPDGLDVDVANEEEEANAIASEELENENWSESNTVNVDETGTDSDDFSSGTSTTSTQKPPASKLSSNEFVSFLKKHIGLILGVILGVPAVVVLTYFIYVKRLRRHTGSLNVSSSTLYQNQKRPIVISSPQGSTSQTFVTEENELAHSPTGKAPHPPPFPQKKNNS